MYLFINLMIPMHTLLDYAEQGIRTHDLCTVQGDRYVSLAPSTTILDLDERSFLNLLREPSPAAKDV